MVRQGSGVDLGLGPREKGVSTSNDSRGTSSDFDRSTGKLSSISTGLGGPLGFGGSWGGNRGCLEVIGGCGETEGVSVYGDVM